MTPPEVVILRHGTTLRRAERIAARGPDWRFVEPGGSLQVTADGFSTAAAGTPDFGLGTPETYARRKARLFPNEGGSVILEVEVPIGIVDLVLGDPGLGPGARSGDVRFEPGVGLEELLQAWPDLVKRVLPL